MLRLLLLATLPTLLHTQRTQSDLAQDMRELLQKEAMRTLERNAIYKSGVHEYSNYLVRQNKSWRHSSVRETNTPNR